MAGLTIGQVARRAGVGVETVRFYERQGLIDEPPRRESGYRDYPAEVVRRIRFIRRGQELGFSLKELRELLDLRVSSQATCGDVRARAEVKIAEIAAKIKTLRQMQDSLGNLVAACDGDAEVGDCPILDALDEE